MSYCRFTKDSDVYAYECDGGVQFWVAVKANNGLNRLCNTYNEAYQYAKSLRDEHGLDVPDYAIETLRFDALEEAKRFSRPNSAVAELQAENAKLRELASILCFCMQIHKQCDDCKLNGAKGEIAYDPLLACDGLHEMLQELGIEVE